MHNLRKSLICMKINNVIKIVFLIAEIIQMQVMMNKFKFFVYLVLQCTKIKLFKFYKYFYIQCLTVNNSDINLAEKEMQRFILGDCFFLYYFF